MCSVHYGFGLLRCLIFLVCVRYRALRVSLGLFPDLRSVARSGSGCELGLLGKSRRFSPCLLVWLHHNNHSHGRVSVRSGWVLPDWASVLEERQVLCQDAFLLLRVNQLFRPQDLAAILCRNRVQQRTRSFCCQQSKFQTKNT